MTIPVLNIQPLTFKQANPFLEGMQTGDQLASNTLAQQLMALRNRQAQIQNQYLPQTLEEQLQSTLLKNRAQAIKNQYQPDLLNTQTQLMQAQIPFTKARTAQTHESTKLLPLATAIKAQAAMNSTTRFGAAYKLNRALQSMPQAARATWIAQHPDQYNQMLSILGNKVLNPQMPTALQYLLKQQFPKSYGEEPQSGQQLNIQKPNIQNQSNAFSFTPEQTAQLQKANMLAANKDLTTGTTRIRYEGAIAASHLLNSPEVNHAFNVLARYSGYQGKTAAQLQRLMNPDQWAEYSSARDQLAGILSGSIKAIESMPTSNEGLRNAKGYFEQAQSALKTNPAAAMKYFNLGRQLLDAEAKSLQTTATPLFNVNRLPKSKPFHLNNEKNNSQYSKSEILAELKRRGLI